MVFPYLKGFDIIKLCFSILFFCIYCGVLYSGIWFLTIGIRALSLGRHCGQIFFIFADFFFGVEKRGQRHSRSFQYIFVQNLQKMSYRSEFLSEKHPI
jgi:hypothetical protein